MTIVVPGRPERPIVVEGESSPDITVQAGRGLPPGGTTGQALIKSSGGNFAAAWGDVTASAAWGGITGTLSSQTDLQTALDGKQPLATVLTNTTASFTTAQETKLSGIATGATANASDAFLLARANHTGTQAASTITGLAAIATSGSAADLTAGTLPAARFDDTAHGSRAGGALHANVVAAGAAGFMTGADKSKLDAITGTNTGDVTLAGTPNYLTIVGQVITRALIDLASHVTGKLPFANIADMANGTLFYRKTAGAGAPETQTLATLKTDLGLTGTNSGDQTITLTSDVTGSGAGSFATTLATVNANVGSFGSATQVATFTVDGKGRTTAAGNTTIAIASTAITDFNSAARAQVEAELIAGTNVTITPGSSGATRTLTIAASGGGGGSLTVQDEGVTLSTAVTTVNFTGAGVTATGTTTVTVNVPGGGASATPWGHIMAARQGLARL